MNGFCISCGGLVHWDRNNPVCNWCRKIRAKPSRLFFCHTCGNNESEVSFSNPEGICCRSFDRHDNSINQHYLNGVARYRKLSQAERKKIKPLWDFGSKYVMFGFECYELKYLTMDYLLNIINESMGYEVENVFKNQPKNNKRIMNVIRSWERKKKTKLPKLRRTKNGLTVFDGHHRILAASYVLEKEILVYVQLLGDRVIVGE